VQESPHAPIGYSFLLKIANDPAVIETHERVPPRAPTSEIDAPGTFGSVVVDPKPRARATEMNACRQLDAT
jgi:hypothetical protein